MSDNDTADALLREWVAQPGIWNQKLWDRTQAFFRRPRHCAQPSVSGEKHSPGPWLRSLTTGRFPIVQLITASDGTIVGEVYGHSDEDCVANALLIASAPDMAARIAALEEENGRLTRAAMGAYVRGHEEATASMQADLAAANERCAEAETDAKAFRDALNASVADFNAEHRRCAEAERERDEAKDYLVLANKNRDRMKARCAQLEGLLDDTEDNVESLSRAWADRVFGTSVDEGWDSTPAQEKNNVRKDVRDLLCILRGRARTALHAGSGEGE